MKAYTADEIKALFPFPRFDPIDGEPTFDSLRKLEIQAIRNAAAIESGIAVPHNDYSGLVEQDAVYTLRVGAPFPRPPNPGANPVFPAGASAIVRAQPTANHQRDINLIGVTCN